MISESVNKDIEILTQEELRLREQRTKNKQSKVSGWLLT